MLHLLRKASRSGLATYPFALVRREFSLFAGLAVGLGGLWVFLQIAEEVIEGDTRAIDEAILLALRSATDSAEPIGPVWLEEAARDMTALGSTSILMLVTLGAFGLLWILGRYGAGFLVLASVLGGMALTNILKFGIGRTRPELVAHLMETFTPSFPSGHATGAAVTYLTIGALLTRLHSDRRVKAYLMGLAVLVTLLVGVTRLYLGVHWPTDVLGGWCIGAAWASFVWLVAYWLQRRGRLREAGATAAPSPPPAQS